MKTMIAGLILAVVLAASFGTALVNAQGNMPPGNQVDGEGFGRGRGPRSGSGMFGDGLIHDEMISILAGKLGLTADELNTRLNAGETIADIASEKDMSVVEFRQLMLDAHTEAVALAVKNGTITQEQADWFKSRPGTERGSGMGMGQGNGLFGEGLIHDEMVTALAGKLGFTADELESKLDDGTTIAQLASDKGLTVVEFRQLMTDARNEAVDLAVKNGTITQAQADWMKSREMMGNGRMGGMGCFGN